MELSTVSGPNQISNAFKSDFIPLMTYLDSISAKTGIDVKNAILKFFELSGKRLNPQLEEHRDQIDSLVKIYISASAALNSVKPGETSNLQRCVIKVKEGTVLNNGEFYLDSNQKAVIIKVKVLDQKPNKLFISCIKSIISNRANIDLYHPPQRIFLKYQEFPIDISHMIKNIGPTGALLDSIRSEIAIYQEIQKTEGLETAVAYYINDSKIPHTNLTTKFTAEIYFPFSDGGDFYDASRDDQIHTNNPFLSLSIKNTFRTLLEGLTVFHEKYGLVHCDIKKENILAQIGYKESNGTHYKIVESASFTDYGFSIKPQNLANNKFFGTFAYWAPEIIDAFVLRDGNPAPVNHKIDCWALGFTLYEFITKNEHPLVALLDDLSDGFQDLRTAQPDEIDEIQAQANIVDTQNKIGDCLTNYNQTFLQNPVIPAPLMPLLCGLLEKDPARRWSSRQALDYYKANVDRLIF